MRIRIRRGFPAVIAVLLLSVTVSVAPAPVAAQPAGQAAAPTPAPTTLPYPKQKALFDILHVMEAWALTKGSPDVKIGVIDLGFDFFHPALKDQLIPGYYAPGGYHLDIYGSVAHGTLVSSLIAAKPVPGVDIVGLAPECRILTACLGLVEQPLLKLKSRFDKEHPGAGLAEFQQEMLKHKDEMEAGALKWTAHMAVSCADAVRYLTDQGVRLVNISALFRRALMPSTEAWQKLEDAFRYAASKNVLIVLGAGNDAREYDDYPGEAGSVIVAGALMPGDKRWEMEMIVGGKKIKQGSSFGRRLTVMAPTQGLTVCVPHEQRFYACDDGPMGASQEKFEALTQWLPNGATSCAAPIVTSLAALVMSLRPDLSAGAVMDVIKRGCDDIGEPGHDIHTGWGRVNYLKTLRLAKEARP